MSVAAVGASGEQRFRLSLVSWEKYEQMVAWLDGRHVRLTYDRGELEIMSPHIEHEAINRALAAVVEIALEESDIDFENAGSTTFKNEVLKRGW